MTALDLGDATRTLTPPGSAFSTVTFGDVDLTPASSPHPVDTVAGSPSIPRATGAGASLLTSDATISPTGDWALFVALAKASALSGFVPVTAGDGSPLLVVMDSDELVACMVAGETVAGASFTALGDVATVIAVTASTTETRFATLADGVVSTGDPAGTFTASTLYLPEDVNGADILGMWLFEATTVSETDLEDTMAAIGAMFIVPPIAVTGAGGWGISGAGVVSVGADDEVEIPDPEDSAGDQEPPTWPEADFAPEGVAPIRHISETMPAPTIVDGRIAEDAWTPTATTDEPWAFRRLVIEGVDVTSYLNVEQGSFNYDRNEPFGPGSARADMPQITPWRPTPSWAKAGANVSYQYLTIDDEEAISAWEGVVTGTSVAADTGIWGIDCEGVLLVSDYQLRKPIASSAPRDIGGLIPDLLNGAVSRRTATMAKVTTGIKRSVAGGWEPTLTGYIQQLLATALKDGRQWTVKCDERTPVLVRKDTTTVNVDVRFGQRGIVADLLSDATDNTNAIYGEGVAANGGRWANWKYPNWNPDDTPPYPFNSPSEWITVGTRDSDTDTGDGVSVWQDKAGQRVTGTFSQDDRRELRRIQERAGITVDGILGPQSWATTFDTGANTGSLDGAFIAPLAVSTKVQPYLYGPDGDKLGANPAYDARLLRLEDKVDFGQGYAKSEAKKVAREMLARNIRPGWAGTVTFTMDPPQMSRFQIREGMNIKLRGFHGQDLMLHIAQVNVSGEVVRVTVDSKARDYPTVEALLAADRNATDPAKAAVRRLVYGRISKDRATFDAESPAGRMPKHAVNGGLWDVRRIPLGEFGTVVRTSWYTDNPTKYCLAVFGRQITAAQLLSLVGNPLTATDNPWEDSDLDDAGLLMAWGWKEQPLGYWPKTYSNPAGVTSASITGRFVDDGSWEFASDSAPWVWVAMMTQGDTYAWGRFYGLAGD